MTVSISGLAFTQLDRRDGVSDGQIRLKDIKSIDKDGKNGISLEEAKQAGLDPRLFTDDIGKLNQVLKEFEGFAPSTLVFNSPTSLTPPGKSTVQPIQRPQPSPTAAPAPPVPGSPAYQKLISQGRAPSLRDVDAFIHQFDIPVLRDNEGKLHEACLNLGEHGPVGIALGTVSATAVELFVPTNVIDLIPDAKVIRKGKAISAIRLSLEELEKFTLVCKKELLERIPSLGPKASSAHFPNLPTVIHVEAGQRKLPWSKTLNSELNPETTYMVNGFQYNTNSAGTVATVAGDLTVPGSRSRWQQVKAGHSGLPGDEGGHLIATILGGPGEAINLFPQNNSFNKSAWRTFEAMLQKAMDEGKKVSLQMKITYGNPHMPHRPEVLEVTYSIDGKRGTQTFRNQPGG